VQASNGRRDVASSIGCARDVQACSTPGQNSWTALAFTSPCGAAIFRLTVHGSILKPIPTIETKRLTLRAFTLNDAPEVQRLAGDRLIADTTLNIPHPYQDGMAQAWISQHQSQFDQGKGVTFAITQKAGGSLVGAIGLMTLDAGHQAELGYWIGRPYWNQGFCTEASEAVLRYAFSELGLVRVHCTHFSRNPASGRVIRKLGMQHEGSRRSHVKKWDKFEDVELYGILKHEWEKAANKSMQNAEQA
jgi:ribosomal-protein-alanine N-acetyltransferase